MRERRVLLDGSFIDALLDAEHPSHRTAVTTYASLIDNHQAGTDRLFALSTVLAAYRPEVRSGALAPIGTTSVGRQHRGAVRKVAASSPEVALTLLMLHRERFHAIVTMLPDFDQFRIEVVSVATDALEDTHAMQDRIPDGYVSYETAPLPARQATDG